MAIFYAWLGKKYFDSLLLHVPFVSYIDDGRSGTDECSRKLIKCSKTAKMNWTDRK